MKAAFVQTPYQKHSTTIQPTLWENRTTFEIQYAIFALAITLHKIILKPCQLCAIY